MSVLDAIMLYLAQAASFCEALCDQQDPSPQHLFQLYQNHVCLADTLKSLERILWRFSKPGMVAMYTIGTSFSITLCHNCKGIVICCNLEGI